VNTKLNKLDKLEAGQEKLVAGQEKVLVLVLFSDELPAVPPVLFLRELL
jgi:hypothetical protein